MLPGSRLRRATAGPPKRFARSAALTWAQRKLEWVSLDSLHCFEVIYAD